MIGKVISIVVVSKVEGIRSLLSYAWSVSYWTIKKYIQQVSKNGAINCERKKRKDIGTNMLTHARKRQQVVTPFSRFVQTYRGLFPGEPVEYNEIKQQWELLDDGEKQEFEHMAQEH